MWCVVVCDLETLCMRKPWPTGGCRAKTNKQTIYLNLSYSLIYIIPRIKKTTLYVTNQSTQVSFHRSGDMATCSCTNCYNQWRTKLRPERFLSQIPYGIIDKIWRLGLYTRDDTSAQKFLLLYKYILDYMFRQFKWSSSGLS